MTLFIIYNLSFIPFSYLIKLLIRWWRGASKLGHVKSQEEMDLAAKELSHAFDYEFQVNSRQVSYKAKWAIFNALWKWNYGNKNI